MTNDRQKRILVTGSTGQVGLDLSRQLPKVFPEAEIIFFERSSLDLSDVGQLKKKAHELYPHIIINAAAYTAVDKAEEEKELAYIINGEVPGILAEVAKKNHGLFIHYSTDYVFGGEKEGPYEEEDSLNPLNIYGESKAQGEVNISAVGGDFIILRTSWVYSEHRHNFLKTILNLTKEKKEISVVSDQYGAPTSSAWLAYVTTFLSQKFFSEEFIEKGIYHAVCSGEATWYSYAQFILECASRKDVALIPVSSEAFPTKAKRPKNSRLSTEKLQKKLNLCPPLWKDELKKIISSLLNTDLGKLEK